MAVTYKMTLDDFNCYVSFENDVVAKQFIAADNVASLALGWRCADNEQTSRFYNRNWELYNNNVLAQCTELKAITVETYARHTARIIELNEIEILEEYVRSFAEAYGFADYDYTISED